MTTNHDALREAQEEPFEKWWKEQGQYGPTGGGEYEKTFAWNAWCAALSQPMPEAAAQGATVADLQRQMREVAEAAYKTPGVAVKMPELVSVEGRKFMRGEPSLFDQLPFGEMQSVTAMLSTSPAAPEVAKPAAEFQCPPGMALVPIRLTREMERYLMEDDWDWPELLGIAGTVTEEQLAQTEAAQPPHPQPQAQGEPEVLVCKLLNVRAMASERLPACEVHTIDQAIAALQSYREALAQHRAALEDCVGALRHLSQNARVSGAEMGLALVVSKDAITHANQVLGKEGA